jgi:hypothetical protein
MPLIASRHLRVLIDDWAKRIRAVFVSSRSVRANVPKANTAVNARWAEIVQADLEAVI